MARGHSTTAPKVWEHKSSGLWCVTRKGRRFYLGSTEDEAVNRYNRYRKSIERGLAIPKLGEDPPEGQEPAAPTVKNLCMVFLHAQKLRVEQKDLSQRSLTDYAKTCQDFCEFVGNEVWLTELTTEHFALFKADVASRRNLVSVGNEVTRVKTIFKWLLSEDKIDRLPNFGKTFVRPKKSDVREYKFNKGRSTFTRTEVLALISELGIHERAMCLLAINAGFGNSDLAKLQLDHVDLDDGYVKNLRSKTKEMRFATLWPETVTAIRLSLQFRNTPIDDAAKEKLFVTHEGRTYVQESKKTGKSITDLLNVRVRAAMQRLKIHQPGMNAYRLRATFRTVANGARDDWAAGVIMGHVRDGMPDAYIDIREIENDPANRSRIQLVTNHVRNWLFGLENV